MGQYPPLNTELSGLFKKEIVYVAAETDILCQKKLHKNEASQITCGKGLKINR